MADTVSDLLGFIFVPLYIKLRNLSIKVFVML